MPYGGGFKAFYLCVLSAFAVNSSIRANAHDIRSYAGIDQRLAFCYDLSFFESAGRGKSHGLPAKGASRRLKQCSNTLQGFSPGKKVQDSLRTERRKSTYSPGRGAQ
jgi:hypothetical protein